MKHRIAGRKLGRTSAHRLALLRNLSRELFVHERLTTTLMKAKELRPFAERLLTVSKRESLHARRQVLRHIPDRDVVAKMFDTLSARYAQRPGGYTRILKLGPRRGDSAEMALIELVGAEVAAKPAAAEGAAKPEKAAKRAKPAAKKAEPKPRTRKAKAETTAKPKADTKAKTKGKAAGGAATRKSGKSGS